MTQQRHPEASEPGIDPSIARGMTRPRISRRQLGAGVGALGLGAFLAACGVKGASAPAGGSTPAGGVGTAAWWAKQKLNHKVNFANWAYYIDVLNGKHPTLEHFTQTTGIAVSYSEAIADNTSFYAKIRPSLQAGQYIGYDIVVLTTNNPPLHLMMNQGWLIPLDHSLMPNFTKYAGPRVSSPPWDPGNKYTMAWQSGWTTVGYNSRVVKNPGDSVNLLFDKKYAGKIGMLSDPYELGTVGMLALGIDPQTSTESDWAKAAKKLQQQKSDGLVRAYYDQNYIDHFKSGDTFVTQAYSGDIFQANLNSKFRDLVMMVPAEGMGFWTDNMCIPVGAQNPKDAMALMDYYYDPQVQAVMEYYENYVCPVPSASQEILNPATAWEKQTIAQLQKAGSPPPNTVANAPTIFPSAAFMQQHSKNYYQFKSQEELNAWNNLFVPIIQGA